MTQHELAGNLNETVSKAMVKKLLFEEKALGIDDDTFRALF